MKINTKKFIEWLESEIVAEYSFEAKATGKGDYATALQRKETRTTYEFIKRKITGEDGEDLGEFMEEEEE